MPGVLRCLVIPWEDAGIGPWVDDLAGVARLASRT